MWRNFCVRTFNNRTRIGIVLRLRTPSLTMHKRDALEKRPDLRNYSAECLKCVCVTFYIRIFHSPTGGTANVENRTGSSVQDQRMRNENVSIFLSATPVPLATARRGSSAMWNWIPILSVRRLSRPRSMAPPPARKIPFITMSE